MSSQSAIYSDTDSGEVEIGSAGEAAQVVAPRGDELRFVLLGDTGGLPLMHETRAQKHVARQLVQRARDEGIDAVITMGDNIYYTGVDNEFDSRFESSFEVAPYWTMASSASSRDPTRIISWTTSAST